ncbi:MAG: ABC transporter permease [Bryobacteraceae bacterium]
MMNSRASILESFKLAVDSLRGSKLRSFLTLLGIILSTTTLIAVMAIIHGMDVYVAKKIADMGAGGFVVVRFAFLGDWDPKKFLELQKKNPVLNVEEYEFLKQRATLIKEIGLDCETNTKVTFKALHEDQASIHGGTENNALLQNVNVATGRYFTPGEDQNRRQVAFLGIDLKEKLFPDADAVGKTIEVEGRPFEVIGVAKRIGNVFGQSQDNFVHVPIHTFFKMYGSRRWISYIMQAIDQEHLEQAMEEVRVLMRAHRHLPPQQGDNFMILTSESIMRLWETITQAIAATAMAVVSVFMVVGGVVIMNIMLAVVTERTHEIGIRKSLGARKVDILRQFLVESAVLSGCGGLAGVLIAWTLAVIVRSATPVPMELPRTAIFVGVGLSAAVGLFFGIYPAQKAAKLDPIEALRAEK